MKRERYVPLLMAMVAVGAVARAVALQFLRPVHWDEIEHFRASDWIRQGLVPFRDFWEHHTPVLWYFGAPFTALTDSPGAGAILLMRWTQVPLWILTFWLLAVWMRDAGLGSFARWAGILTVASSSLLMIPSGEFRPDTLAALLFVAGLVLLQRVHVSRRYAFFAGVVFCLAGLTNLRLGPLLAITALLARILDAREKRWVGVPRIHWTYAGVIATLGAALGFFAANGSLRPFLQSVWMENFVGNRIQEGVPLMFLHRITGVFGYRLIGVDSGPHFELASVDVAGAALLILGTIGAVRQLVRNRREPDDLFFLACLQVASVLFVWGMKFIYSYHFVIIAVLATPFVAAELERIANRRVVVAFLVCCCAVNVFAALFRGKEHDRAYQDLIMREAHRHTAPDASICDGAGWVRGRRPAYKYWFLPSLVLELERRGQFEPLRPEQVLADPPGALIADRNVLVWLSSRKPLRDVFTRHYFPVWRNLWLPGPNGLLQPSNPAMTWVVPADGVYRLHTSRPLVAHPWFHVPLRMTQLYTPLTKRFEIPVASIADDGAVEWRVNGRVVTTPTIALRRLDRLEARLLDDAPTAVLAIRGNPSTLVMQPRPGITLEAIEAPETHVPDLTPTIR